MAAIGGGAKLNMAAAGGGAKYIMFTAGGGVACTEEAQMQGGKGGIYKNALGKTSEKE